MVGAESSREVNAYSDVPERASEAQYDDWPPRQRPEWKVTVDQIPRCFRKALQQPPRLTAIAHGKLSTYVCSKTSRVRTKLFSRYTGSQPLQTYSLARIAFGALVEG